MKSAVVGSDTLAVCHTPGGLIAASPASRTSSVRTPSSLWSGVIFPAIT